jgi:hypothetical protein
MSFSDDYEAAREVLDALPTVWIGRDSILAMKDGGSRHWRQMEWIGWFFEWLTLPRLGKAGFRVPGDLIGRTEFDAARSANWDLKAHAIKSHVHDAILNDVAAIDTSISTYGFYGVIVAMLDVEYNDEQRAFQKWHSELKGGLSVYEVERRERTAASRYRKTHAILRELLFIHVDAALAQTFTRMQKGMRNSNGKPRLEKYSIRLDRLSERHFKRVKLA